MLILTGYAGVFAQESASNAGNCSIYSVNNLFPSNTQAKTNVFAWTVKIEGDPSGNGLSHFNLVNTNQSKTCASDVASLIKQAWYSTDANPGPVGGPKWSTTSVVIGDGSTDNCLPNGTADRPYVIKFSDVAPFIHYALEFKSKYPVSTGVAVPKYGNNCCSTPVQFPNFCDPEPLCVDPTFTVNKTDLTCFESANGSISVTGVTGGASPYTYSINGGTFSGSSTFSNLSAGTYTVRVKESEGGCFTEKEVVITQPAAVVAAITGDLVICEGKSTTLTATGGTTYSWDNGGSGSSITVSPTTTTTYTVTATKDGCTDQAQATVTVNALPTVTADDASVCAGSPVTLSASPSGGSWTKLTGSGSLSGASFTAGSSAGTATFRYTYTDNNTCVNTDDATVTINALPTVSVNSPVVCKDNTTLLTANASGGSSSYNYTWNTNPVQTTKAITVSTAGTYSVTVTDGNGCVAIGTGTVTTYDCKVFCTYTQGYYGNVGGKSCNGIGPDGNAAGVLYSSTTERMIRAFENYFNTNISNNLTATSTITFGSSSTTRKFDLTYIDITSGKIYTLLPGGGTPAALNEGPWNSGIFGNGKKSTTSPLDSRGKIRNNLLSQTIVLWFNIQTSPGLGDWIMPASFKTVKPACGTTAIDGLTPDTYNVPSGLAGLTINQLLEQANKALGAQTALTSLSNIHTTVDMINRAFDECRYLVSSEAALTRVPILNPVEVVNANSPINVNSNVQLVTFPNPYIDQVTFNVTVKNAGKGSLVIYNMLGQKVTNLFEGNMQANSTQTIRYNVPFAQRKNLVYVFRQNDTISTGKLVSGK